jgi:hypothetical protein
VNWCERGVDGVFEQYGARKRSTDFKTGEKLGARDHLVVLEKPIEATGLDDTRSSTHKPRQR